MTLTNTHSILFSALKTSLPIPRPIGNVTPGALNLSHASRKLIAQTNPIQRKVTISTRGYFIVNIVLLLYVVIRIILSEF